MTDPTPKTAGEEQRRPGKLYRYMDEDGATIALAVMAKGPNGGDVGVNVAQMPVPFRRVTRAEIEANARFMEKAWNCHDELVAALEFYANPEIYKPHPHGPAFDRRDLSATARAALARAPSPNQDAPNA